MPSARVARPSRTRTARTNGRSILALSTIPVQELNLLPGEMSLVCPDCRTWCPITGLQKPKATPHRRPAHQGGNRCPGGNQLLNLDITLDQWREQLHAIEATATYRRAPRQHHKPTPQPLVPVHRLAARGPQATPTLLRLIPLLEQARDAVLQHRASCSPCRAGRRCAAGRDLEIRFGETQASCTIAREQQDQADRAARKQTAPAVRKAQWAKRGGEAVEKANNLCSERTSGSLSEFRGPQLPLAPQDVEAHERRQAELGKRYVRRNSTTSAA
ncbi:hypothetical protein [Streptomyces sp. NPDC050485]|uniref:hypothetical protein n=1 Tax=Streptomyces sp. NPDC050485 TaxID=3365617 RepID=UPI003789B040